MKKIGRTKVSRVRDLLAGLQSLTESLPSEEERTTITSSLAELSAYLDRVQRDLLSLPIKEDVQSLITTVEKLDSLLMKAEANPGVARALGLERKAAPRAKATAPPVDNEKVEALLKSFESKTIDQIREALRDDGECSTSELRAVAVALGLRTQARMGRDALAQKLITQISNARGYRSLSQSQD
jgi:hypothetical protein